jgi:hypothetical protein
MSTSFEFLCTYAHPSDLDGVPERVLSWLSDKATAWCCYSSATALVGSFQAAHQKRCNTVRLSLTRALKVSPPVTIVVKRACLIDTEERLSADGAYILIARSPSSSITTFVNAQQQHAMQEGGNDNQDLQQVLEPERHTVPAEEKDVWEMVTNLQDQVHMLQEKLKEVEARNNTTNTYNIINNTYIIINDFGHEDLSYMTAPEELLKLRSSGVLKAIDQIYFNKDHVQNQNVRLKSQKSAQVEEVQNGMWTSCSMNAINNAMIQKAFKIITRRFVVDVAFREKALADHGDGLMEWQMRMMAAGFERQKEMVPLRRMVEAMLVDKRPQKGAPQKAIACV